MDADYLLSSAYAIGPGDQEVQLPIDLTAQLEFAAEFFNLRDVDLHLLAVRNQVLPVSAFPDELEDLRARLFVSELDLERRLVCVVPERSGQQVRPDPRLVIHELGRQQNRRMR